MEICLAEDQSAVRFQKEKARRNLHNEGNLEKTHRNFRVLQDRSLMRAEVS